jgi:hypothetical protein
MFSMHQGQTQGATELRICSKCGEAKPLTPENFQADTQKGSGFRPDCKVCRHAAYATKRPDAPKLRVRALAAIGLKPCCACKASLPLSYFGRRSTNADGLMERCRTCVSAYAKSQRAANTERVDGYAKAYKKRNVEAVRRRAREYAARRRGSDPRFRLRGAISRLVGCHMKRRGTSKAGRAFFDAVGYTPSELCGHIERQFLAGMEWGNYGAWHVDHILPNVSFDYEDMDSQEFRSCWALSNLRPMWAPDNLKKGAKALSLL